jgi:hypothetical protein
MSLPKLSEEEMKIINMLHRDHAYDSCRDNDESLPNAGFNRCPRCTQIVLAKWDKIRPVIAELKNMRNISVHGDFTVKMEFASVRSAVSFKQQCKDIHDE